MTEYFVKVDDGKELRKELLESSKLCIHILKLEQKILHIRKQKEHMHENVRQSLKEITFLLGSLEKDLPVLTKRELEEMGVKKPLAQNKTTKKKQTSKKTTKQNLNVQGKEEAASVQSHKEFSKLERLEKSLELIEERLQKL